MRRKIRDVLRPKNNKKKINPYDRKLKSLLNNFHAIVSNVIWKCSILFHPSKVWGENKMPRGLKFLDKSRKSGQKGADSNNEC